MGRPRKRKPAPVGSIEDVIRERLALLGEVPEAPPLDAKDPDGWIRARLKQVSPWLVEQRVLAAVLAGDVSAAQEVLDRAGWTRKPEAVGGTVGPVLILNGESLNLPYDAQLVRTVDGRITSVKELHGHGNDGQSDGGVHGYSERHHPRLEEREGALDEERGGQDDERPLGRGGAGGK